MKVNDYEIIKLIHTFSITRYLGLMSVCVSDVSVGMLKIIGHTQLIIFIGM
jgi:hypothetical protein